MPRNRRGFEASLFVARVPGPSFGEIKIAMADCEGWSPFFPKKAFFFSGPHGWNPKEVPAIL